MKFLPFAFFLAVALAGCGGSDPGSDGGADMAIAVDAGAPPQCMADADCPSGLLCANDGHCGEPCPGTNFACDIGWVCSPSNDCVPMTMYVGASWRHQGRTQERAAERREPATIKLSRNWSPTPAPIMVNLAAASRLDLGASSLFLVGSNPVLFRVSPDKKVHVTPGVTAEQIAETWYRIVTEGHCRY